MYTYAYIYIYIYTSILQACMRRKVEDKWVCDLATKAKLALVKLLKEKGSQSRCLDVAEEGQ